MLREPAEERCESRLVPQGVELAGEAGDEHEVDGMVADDLVGDRDPPVAGVVDVRAVHACVTTARPATSGWTIPGMPRQRWRARSVSAKWRRSSVSVSRVQSQPPAMAAHGRLEPLLPARGARVVVGAHVLDEEERAVRSEDAPELGHGGLRVGDRAEDHGGDRRVEAPVREGQGLGAGLDDHGAGADDRGAGAPPEPARHRRVGLREDELVRGGGVVREVQPGPGADLERASPGAADRRGPQRAHAPPLAERQDEVVEPGGAGQRRRDVGGGGSRGCGPGGERGWGGHARILRPPRPATVPPTAPPPSRGGQGARPPVP